MARAPSTRTRRLLKAARLTPADGLLPCPPITPVAPRATWPGASLASDGATAISNNGDRPTQGHQPSARLTNTGARREAPDPGDSRQPATAGNPAATGSDRSHGSQQSRLTKREPANNQAGQRFH